MPRTSRRSASLAALGVAGHLPLADIPSRDDGTDDGPDGWTTPMPSDGYATARSSESSNHECASPTVTSSPVMSPTSSQ
ncbi:hypothetical protein SBI_02676 [Streptomyces bingchenggensis BCW-1]|uniref:Uncharacterized protein n=1 Tax=Streptomyces bingchenggensis (strain BCW-1) TaxID=749414 RepID=D7C0S5_STRBB|nr:hypothetical protein SBI_02676 [Streptomyces bingchenggensis BCW-1]